MRRLGEQRERTFDLDRLFADQDADLVIDAIPAVLAWVSSGPYRAAGECRFSVDVARQRRRKPIHEWLELRWNAAALRIHDPMVEQRAERMRSGRTPQREHVTELAAYGLALVAISVFLPGRRVVGWNRYSAPDILLDARPGRLRGVEAAGRSRGGIAALRAICDGNSGQPGKRAGLLVETSWKHTFPSGREARG